MQQVADFAASSHRPCATRSIRSGRWFPKSRNAVATSAAYNAAAMGKDYDTDDLLEKARQWREEAAIAADAVHRDLYLNLAAKCERLMLRSFETPSIRTEAKPNR